MANDTRGVFRLRTLRRENVEGDGVPLDDVWVNPEYGVPFAYFAGGKVPAGPSYSTIVDKLQFSSDSIARSPSADLDFNSYTRNPVSSSTAAYWISGEKGPSVPGPSDWTSKTSKTTYSSDTTASAGVFPIGTGGGLGWDELGSTATETTGYVGGGSRTPGMVTTVLYKLNFSTDGYSSLPNFPQYQMHTGDALGNQTHGYWSGGTQVPSGTNSGSTGHGAHTIVARFTYSTDTHSNVATLPAPRKTVSASGNATEGYLFGGIDGHPSGSATWHSTAIKLTYATDTTSLNPSNLAEYPRVSTTRASGNLSYGYGVGAGNPTTGSNVFKFDYSTGTQSSPASLKRPVSARQVANASSKAYGHPGKFPTERWKDGASETMNKGHFAADNNNKSLYSLEMNTDSAAIMPAATNIQGYWQSQGFSNLTNGWYAGGSNPGGTSVNQIVKTPYATDTPNPSVASMVERRRGPMIAGNMTHARIAGGFSHDNPGDRRSNFEKFTYSTESSALLPSVNLPQKDSKGGGSGNQELGYYTGGEYSYSWYYKVTYSTDTGAQVPSANQSPVNGPSSRSFASTLANFRAGASTNSVQKVPFADDTFSLLPSVSPANLGSNSGGAGANRTHGYYTHANGSSYMYKMSFATETADQLTTYPATNGMGNSLQGQSNGPVTAIPTATPTPSTSGTPVDFGLRVMYNGSNTNIGKLDFTTDSTSKLTDQPGPFTASDANGGWNDNVNGKMVYGTAGAGPDIFGLPYTTGTVTKISNAPITPGENAATSKVWTYSTTHGFFSGGRSYTPSYPSHHTNTSRYTFSTDTIETSYPSQRLVHAVEAAKGVANSTHAYVTGGRTDNPGATDKSYVQKASFSTGDFAQVPSANLNAVTSGHNLTGNLTSARIAGKDAYGGEQSPESRFQKLTYSNDTMTILPGSTLPGTPSSDHGKGVAATGNQTQGYFGGSDAISPATNVKIVYATDTTSETPAWANEANVRDTVAKSACEQNGNGTSQVSNMMK